MRLRPLLVLVPIVSSTAIACRVEPRTDSARQWSVIAASNMTPEFEDPELELLPPSSPIYPNPGLMGCNTFASCKCDEVQVFCGSPWTQFGCKIGIPSVACHALGLFPPSVARPGAVVDPECILAPTPEGPPVFEEIGTMVAYCGFQHEAHHACHGDDVDRACSEESAYGTSEACLRGFYERQCEGADSMPMYCSSLLDLISQQVGFGALEACLCRGATECTPCIDACKATGLADGICKQHGYPACGRDEIPALSVMEEF